MFRWRGPEEEGERAARPYVRSVSGNPKRKRGKKLILEKSVSLFGSMGRTKNPRKNAMASFFFFIQLTGPKAFYRLQQNRGKDCGFVRPKGLAVCSLYIEDALPSTSHCTCRLNNVHTCQQIRKLLSHAFFPILHPSSHVPHANNLTVPIFRHLG